ncbi:MAG: NTP transferase domain-containing protein [Oscillospiraceae bacterium]|nr:NTP transferase domain-containing protein [Oscillospiraceae bacterium]
MRNKTEIKPEKNIVIKRFRSRIARDKERYVLSVMDGSGLTPRLYDRSGCCLTMEYRPGQLISDILYCPDTALVTDVLKKLADWLTDFRRYFYRQTGSHIVLEDINPRNFIYNHSTGRITGIDFESWHTGEKTENYISLLTMVKSAHSCDDDTSRAAYDRIFRYCGKFFTENPENVEKTVDLSVQGALNRRKAMTAVRKTGCAILAGGKSSRMGSDKGMLPLGEYTFIDHIICNAQIFDSMCISGDNPAYSCFGLPLVGDNYAGCGPLGRCRRC